MLIIRPRVSGWSDCVSFFFFARVWRYRKKKWCQRRTLKVVSFPWATCERLLPNVYTSWRFMIHLNIKAGAKWRYVNDGGWWDKTSIAWGGNIQEYWNDAAAGREQYAPGLFLGMRTAPTAAREPENYLVNERYNSRRCMKPHVRTTSAWNVFEFHARLCDWTSYTSSPEAPTISATTFHAWLILV